MLRSTSDVGYYVIVMECLVVWTASESLYSTIPNVKPNDNFEAYDNHWCTTATFCAMKCSLNRNCRSALWEDRFCQFYEEEVDVSSTLPCSNCVVMNVEPRTWTLVFRITPDLGIGAADSWYRNEAINDGDDSLRTTESTPAGIYKSSLATPSGWHGVAMVKVAMYTGGIEKMQITFDASGATLDSWFSKDNIINSSYPNLKTASPSYFSLNGYILDGLQRRFYIASHCGCSCDNGWMTVLDPGRVGSHCAWDRRDTFPKLLYSRLTANQTALDFGLADVFAIFVYA